MMNYQINLNSVKRPPSVLPEAHFLKNENTHLRAMPQWMWAKQAQKLLAAMLENQRVRTETKVAKSSAVQPASYPLKSELTTDRWGFGWSWHSITTDFPTVKSLYDAIKARRRQINVTRETWRPSINASKLLDPLHDLLAELAASESSLGSYRILEKHLELIEEGISGSYLLFDSEGNKRFVVKPIDEDIGCLNNRKDFASPYTESTIRNNMTLYRSALRETLAYEIAQEIGVSNVAPRTSLAILESDAFHDQFDSVSYEERLRYQEIIGNPVREKLCSVQEFVPNSKTLSEGMQDLQQAGLSDDEIAGRIDQRDFEDANILLWATYDTDGHMNNFLVYPKSVDAVGNEILGIKKIDNGLAFPEKNEQLRNNLRYLPNSREILSAEGRAKIAALSIDTLCTKLEAFGLEGSIDAMRERIAILKDLAKRPDLTLRDIDYRMSLIGRENGRDLALSPMSQKEIKAFIKEGTS